MQLFLFVFFGGNCCSQLHCSNLQPCLSDWQGSNALAGTTNKGRWLLSPSHFGWPANRPRLYTLLVKRGPVALRNGGVRLMNKLYRIPLLSVDKLMVAPQESSLDGKISWFLSCSAALLALILICELAFLKTKDIVREYRLTLAHKLHRSLDSTFVDLLSGSQRIWLDVYRRHPKVTRAWEAGIILSVSVIVWFLSLTLCCFLFTKDKALKPHGVIAVGSWRCIFHSINVAWSQGKHVVVANLCQNPRSRPIVSSLCPTLLRQGHMFVLQNPHQQHLHPGFCERALFGKEWQVEFVYMFNVQCSMFKLRYVVPVSVCHCRSTFAWWASLHMPSMQ